MHHRLVVLFALLVACQSESAAPGESVDAESEVSAKETAAFDAPADGEGGAADGADAADVCSNTPPSLPCCEDVFYTGSTYKCPTCASLTRDIAQCRWGAWSWAVNDDCWFACRDSGPTDADADADGD
ncbi:MAG: hypothetical protein IPJ34_11965 [Myxococcales bacterium]|nr:hypothetical protein [Myxococcales bacterium]